MFERFLYQLRGQGLPVGTQEWLAFQRGLKAGLAGTVEEFYYLGRSLLVHTESHYDQYSRAFNATMQGVAMDPAFRQVLEEYLNNPKAWDPDRESGQHDYQQLLDLLNDFRKTLEEQNERHEGGNRWVGTGGTSPYGQGGSANQGLALGKQAGNRTGIRLPDSMDWGVYREDRQLALRDFKIALKALRNLEKEGPEEFSVEESIQKTARNAGEIELVFQREKTNKARVALFLDVGGSMDPHAQRVTQLFTAAKETKSFKSLDVWHFHNCVYQRLYSDADQWNAVPTEEVLGQLRKTHRVLFVGDAAMAPWELFSSYTPSAPSGLDWLRKIRNKCPASVWLNPDPERYWQHPTVEAIGEIYPMMPLTLQGLRDAVRTLRGVAG